MARVSARVGSATLTLEVAHTPETRARGLMFRHSLGDDAGMLFVFEQPQFLRFWMRNTYIPLSIAFLRDDGTIINIVDMEPHEEQGGYWSQEKSQLAVEVNQGWFERHGISAGDRIHVAGYTTASTHEATSR